MQPLEDALQAIVEVLVLLKKIEAPWGSIDEARDSYTQIAREILVKLSGLHWKNELTSVPVDIDFGLVELLGLMQRQVAVMLLNEMHKHATLPEAIAAIEELSGLRRSEKPQPKLIRPC